MNNIAITGSFASGKSYAINFLKKMGYKVFSCDAYVKILYKDINIQNQIISELKGLNDFDKNKISDIIYSNDKERKKLEHIVHPLVRQGIKEFERKNIDERLIFTEVPLLFENDFDKNFTKVICVFCSEETRKKRVEKRNLRSIKIFQKIKQIQLPQEIKKEKADYIVDSEQNVEKQLLQIIDQIKNEKRNNT